MSRDFLYFIACSKSHVNFDLAGPVTPKHWPQGSGHLQIGKGIKVPLVGTVSNNQLPPICVHQESIRHVHHCSRVNSGERDVSQIATIMATPLAQLFVFLAVLSTKRPSISMVVYVMSRVNITSSVDDSNFKHKIYIVQLLVYFEADMDLEVVFAGMLEGSAADHSPVLPQSSLAVWKLSCVAQALVLKRFQILADFSVLMNCVGIVHKFWTF